jgi:hypothetical protein
MNTDLISLLSDRMEKVFVARGMINLIIPIAFSAFSLILFHIYILPAILKASNRRYELLKVLSGIPHSAVSRDILPKYEDEIDDMDDEQEAQKVKRAAHKEKDLDKVKKTKREINLKLYFLMAALFASISIMEIVYQIYTFTQQPNELVVYQTMKHLVCHPFPFNTSHSSLFCMKPSMRLNGLLGTCLTEIARTFATISIKPATNWGLRLNT